jgi:hypothetical protein
MSGLAGVCVMTRCAKYFGRVYGFHARTGGLSTLDRGLAALHHDVAELIPSAIRVG